MPGISGEIEWGFKRYTKYEPGDMAVIITAPHGGKLKPSTQSNGKSWPDRKNGCKGRYGECIWTHSCGVASSDCYASRYSDVYTAAIAQDIADGIKAITGTRPHVVYNNLHRRKMDANREVNESTLNVPDAIKAYQDYTNFIRKAWLAINITGRGLLLDIHGHVHPLQRTELGYLIFGSKLDTGEYSVESTSVKNLVQHHCGLNDDLCFKSFIHGNRSLGHFMNLEDLAAVPSPQDETPNVGQGHEYFSGGYTVKTYGSKNGGKIDAIQMEFPKTLRSNWGNNTKFEVARAIKGFFELNY